MAAPLNPRPRKISEPILVPVKLHGLFPKTFVWRGQRHDIRSVESCRTEVKRGWPGNVQRHHFTVRTEGAVFELAQDLARDTWELERVWANDQS